jgi:hypothetical protein
VEGDASSLLIGWAACRRPRRRQEMGDVRPVQEAPGHPGPLMTVRPAPVVEECPRPRWKKCNIPLMPCAPALGGGGVSCVLSIDWFSIILYGHVQGPSKNGRACSRKHTIRRGCPDASGRGAPVRRRAPRHRRGSYCRSDLGRRRRGIGTPSTCTTNPRRQRERRKDERLQVPRVSSNRRATMHRDDAPCLGRTVSGTHRRQGIRAVEPTKKGLRPRRNDLLRRERGRVRGLNPADGPRRP